MSIIFNTYIIPHSTKFVKMIHEKNLIFFKKLSDFMRIYKGFSVLHHILEGVK